MATSAKNEASCGQNGHYHLYMTIVVNSQDKTNNKSNVTVKMYARSDSSSYGAYNSSSSANSAKMTVNGSQVVSKTMAMDFRNKVTVNLASWTGDIAHGSDGTKKLTCSGSFSISGTSSLSGGSVSCAITLDDIPRATTPTLSAPTVELGKAVTIGISPAVSTWTHTLYYQINSNAWIVIATGIKANYSWTVPLVIASSFPNVTSGKITLYLKTLNGSATIGTKSIELGFSIPASVKPSVSALTISDTMTELAAYGYVQGKSKLKLTASVTEAYGSEIASYRYQIGSQAYSALSNTYTMADAVRDSGAVTVKVTATDSRGRTAEKSVSINVLLYASPQVALFDCIRCGNSSGAINNNGGYLKVSMKFDISALGNKNSKSYKVEYCLKDATEWINLTSGAVYTYDGTYISGSAILNTANSYKIRLTVADSFTSVQFIKEVGTAVRLLSYIIKKSALAIGKAADTANLFDVNLQALFRKSVNFTGGIKENGTALSEKYNPALTFASASASGAVSFESGKNVEICRITLQPGYWLLLGVMSWPNNTSGYREIGFNTTLASAGRWATQQPAVQNVNTWIRQQNVRIVDVASDTTQTWIFYGQQNSGATLSSQYATVQAIHLK